MPFNVQNAYNIKYIECVSNDFVMRSEQDVLELISACYEHDTNNIILHEVNLSPDFFDLKTNLAGKILQKFANYHLRGAGVIPLGKIKSDRFKELVLECNRGNLFRFFEDKEAAEKWLANE
jgi:hypothetical protein